MSKAFDSLDRRKLLFILTNIPGITESDLRLIRLLLANTSLQVKIGKRRGRSFLTIMGIPQGCGLSPILFTVYLEAACREVRAVDRALWWRFTERDWLTSILELAYADDLDYVSVDKEHLDVIFNLLPRVFGEQYNLTVNTAKTERKVIDRKCKASYKKLGCHLDVDTDVNMRVGKAEYLFGELSRPWLQKEVGLRMRIRLYTATVRSILIYNIGGIPLSPTHVNKLNTVHRKHLRRLLGTTYHDGTTTELVYRRTQVPPLCATITQARWQYFRLALLAPPNRPERQLMDSYFDSHCKPPARPTTAISLPTILNNDLACTGLTLLKTADLSLLTELARDAANWGKLQRYIVAETAAAAIRAERAKTLSRKRKKDETTNAAPTPLPAQQATTWEKQAIILQAQWKQVQPEAVSPPNPRKRVRQDPPPEEQPSTKTPRPHTTSPTKRPPPQSTPPPAKCNTSTLKMLAGTAAGAALGVAAARMSQTIWTMLGCCGATKMGPLAACVGASVNIVLGQHRRHALPLPERIQQQASVVPLLSDITCGALAGLATSTAIEHLATTCNATTLGATAGAALGMLLGKRSRDQAQIEPSETNATVRKYPYQPDGTRPHGQPPR